MANPPWWEELVAVSDVLRDADRAEVERWRRPGEVEDEDDVPPVTIRLGSAAHVYAEHAAGFTEEQTRRLFRLLEELLEKGGDDGDAVATGFFEALLNAWDNGFDLNAVWPEVGPEARAYCRAWNDFTGVGTPGWMR
ncbi:hypothetical protein [Kitasatospora sp. NPDC057500]|uniref:DUF7674 family protein n=1 Tax=Kitasatospora sp. NPDC057500 TaxID=3346151 RepID=UPI0036B5CFE1